MLAKWLLYLSYIIIASLLVHRWKRARGLHQIAEEKFNQLSTESSGIVLLNGCESSIMCLYIKVSISEKLVKEWIDEEKATVCYSIHKTGMF